MDDIEGRLRNAFYRVINVRPEPPFVTYYRNGLNSIGRPFDPSNILESGFAVVFLREYHMWQNRQRAREAMDPHERMLNAARRIHNVRQRRLQREGPRVKH